MLIITWLSHALRYVSAVLRVVEAVRVRHLDALLLLHDFARAPDDIPAVIGPSPCLDRKVMYCTASAELWRESLLPITLYLSKSKTSHVLRTIFLWPKDTRYRTW